MELLDSWLVLEGSRMVRLNEDQGDLSQIDGVFIAIADLELGGMCAAIVMFFSGGWTG